MSAGAEEDTQQSIAFMEGFYEGNKAAWEKDLVCLRYDQYLKLLNKKPELVK